MTKNWLASIMILLLALLLGCSKSIATIDYSWHMGNGGAVPAVLNLKGFETKTYATCITQDSKYFIDGKSQSLHSIAVVVIFEEDKPYHELRYRLQFNKSKKSPINISREEPWIIKYLTDKSIVREMRGFSFSSTNGVLDILGNEALILHDDLSENSSLFFTVSAGQEEFMFSLNNDGYVNEISKIILRKKEIPFGSWQKVEENYYQIFLECFEEPRYLVELDLLTSYGVFYMDVLEVNDDGFYIGKPDLSYTMDSFNLTSTTGYYSSKAEQFLAQSFDYIGEAKQVFDTDSLILLELIIMDNSKRTFFINDSLNFHKLTSTTVNK